MTDDGLLIVQWIFTTVWQLFTSWHLPGTNVTPAEMFLFLAAAGIGWRFISKWLDFGGAGVGSAARGASAIHRSNKADGSNKKGG